MVLSAGQLGLVYFPLPSNKRHFLVLMARKESVVKIQPHDGSPPFIMHNGSGRGVVPGGYDSGRL